MVQLSTYCCILCASLLSIFNISRKCILFACFFLKILILCTFITFEVLLVKLLFEQHISLRFLLVYYITITYSFVYNFRADGGCRRIAAAMYELENYIKNAQSVTDVVCYGPKNQDPTDEPVLAKEVHLR